jgi:NAD(P)-dependent dehydrogenase (short-subunit alcohol dehydrogenase family)
MRGTVRQGLLEGQPLADRPAVIGHPITIAHQPSRGVDVDLSGRTAIVTGGTSGIGRATAELLAGAGANVAITGRDETRGAEVLDRVRELGAGALFVRADVRSAADCERTVGDTLEAFGRVDVLVNNAGVYQGNTALGCSEEEWDRQLDTNLKGTFLMSRAVLPHMIERGSGSIVNNASDWGLVGGAEAVAYCASKGGVVLMTKAMAIDHGPQGIRINAVCPGDTDTPMETLDAEQHGIPWDEYVAVNSQRPLGRMGAPEEVARAIVFLASDDASFITGAALAIDGGATAG